MLPFGSQIQPAQWPWHRTHSSPALPPRYYSSLCSSHSTALSLALLLCHAIRHAKSLKAISWLVISICRESPHVRVTPAVGVFGIPLSEHAVPGEAVFHLKQHRMHM